ncbi:MAG: uracil phosphoribosyltransferase [Nanoarchaeota archaeon]|nr:uracil phosphoribosyltransferase [Nanoarchaeota archaeon]
MNTKSRIRKNPALERILYKIRDPATGREEFRSCLERIGEYIGVEISLELEQERKRITTSLGKETEHFLLKESPVLIGVLRAGLPLYYGMQKAFPESESGFIGTMRDEKTLKSHISYCALPDIEGKTVILIDTMLATGGSMIEIAEMLKEKNPRAIITASVIASRQGIERMRTYDSSLRIYSAVIDPILNDKGYIVPGLGDAGDRCYGEKK